MICAQIFSFLFTSMNWLVHGHASMLTAQEFIIEQKVLHNNDFTSSVDIAFTCFFFKAIKLAMIAKHC